MTTSTPDELAAARAAMLAAANALDTARCVGTDDWIGVARDVATTLALAAAAL